MPRTLPWTVAEGARERIVIGGMTLVLTIFIAIASLWSLSRGPYWGVTVTFTQGSVRVSDTLHEIVSSYQDIPVDSRVILIGGRDARGYANQTLFNVHEVVYVSPSGVSQTVRVPDLEGSLLPLQLLVALIFTLLGVVVFRWSPDAALRSTFLIFGFSVGCALASAPAGVYGYPWAGFVSGVGAMSAGVAFVLFFLSFPRPVPRFVGISAILSLITLGFTLLQAAWDFSNLWLPAMIDAALWVWFAANLSAAVVILAVRASQPSNRRQFSPIVVGCVVGTLPIICLTAIPYLINHTFMVRPEVSAVGAVAVPLSFAYAILRHHLFGLDALLRRFLIWLAEAASIALVAGGAWLVVSWLCGGPTAIAAAAVFLGLVTPILIPRVMLAVDAVFYPTIARARVGPGPLQSGTLDELGVQLTRTTRELLPTHWAALVIRGARASDTLERIDRARCRVVAVDGASPTFCPIRTTWTGPALQLEGGGLEGSTVVRIESNGTVLGALVVGPRLDASTMSGIDRETLNLLASRSVVPLEAALLREQAEEEERYRQGLAAFARDLALAGSTEKVLEITAQHARRILDAGGAAIWQRDASEEFRLASFDGDIGTPDVAALPAPLDAVRDTPVAAGEPGDLGLSDEASFLAFRLDGSDRLDAVGALVRSAEPGPFGPRDARRAAEVVEYASGALGRARAVAAAAEAETLREINRVRTEIFDMVSHDLQSPLTVVRGYAELLQIRGDEVDPAFVDEAAESILTAYRSCQSLIDDLLTSARLEKGRLTVNSVELDPREILQDLIAGYRVVPGGERLVLNAPEGLRIRADRTRLEQMVGNLVSNALRYAPHGEIELRVYAMEGEPLAAIEVRDHGPGIAPADLARVWEKFFRSGAEQTTPRGAGVGLSVVRALAELHGGRADVESVLGEGTTFRICLPLAPTRSQEPEARRRKDIRWRRASPSAIASSKKPDVPLGQFPSPAAGLLGKNKRAGLEQDWGVWPARKTRSWGPQENREKRPPRC